VPDVKLTVRTRRIAARACGDVAKSRRDGRPGHDAGRPGQVAESRIDANLCVETWAGHVALLGDSVFDNGSCTGGEPDVVAQLRAIFPAGWRASLFAVDGSTADDLGEQLSGIGSDVTHFVASVGGNDALLNSDILDLPVSSTREALLLFGTRAARFEAAYRNAICGALELGRPVVVCTIYNGNLGSHEAPAARVALMLFNDAILRVAFENELRVIDLRLVCREASDYANPVEPSAQGGAKIARAIARALGIEAG
jgi:hypothetical protein